MVSKNKKTAKAPVQKQESSVRVDPVKTSELCREKEVEKLIDDLRSGNDEIIRSSAAGALGHTKSEKAIGPLIAALKDNHVYVRHGAAWALGEIRSDRAVEALNDALNDADEMTRNKAAEALEKIQGKI